MNIILIGFMGSGKTTLAKMLAKDLGWQAVEMDDLILKKSKRKSINEIFQKDGELEFRRLEMAVAQSLSKTKNKIISTGGGVIMNQVNLLTLKKTGRVIYLKDGFEQIVKRLKNDQTRPLIQDKKKAKELFKLREPLYAFYADRVIDCVKNPKLDSLAKQIIKGLK